MSLCIA